MGSIPGVRHVTFFFLSKKNPKVVCNANPVLYQIIADFPLLGTNRDNDFVGGNSENKRISFRQVLRINVVGNSREVIYT